MDDWPGLSDAAKAKAIVDWNCENYNRIECRAIHGIKEMVSKEDTHEFNTTLADLPEIYGERTPPAMPCYTARGK